MDRAFTNDLHETKKAEFDLSIKSISENGMFSGYASVFNVIDSHKDLIVKGAFANSLKENSNIKLLWQHRPDEPIGIFTNITEDDHGLRVEGKLLMDVQRAKEAFALLKSGAIKGMSIGYTPIAYDYDPETGVRILRQVDLWEISLVTFPANPEAEVMDIKNSPHEHLVCGDKELAELRVVFDKAIAALN